MIMMEMGGLALRLTQRARIDATSEVNHWLQAIDSTKQAEQLADIIINLPSHFVDTANRSASIVQSADYVTAVGIADKAFDATEQILATAVACVEKELGVRKTGLQKAQSDLIMATQELKKELSEIESKYRTETEVPVKSRVLGASTKPDIIEDAKAGCLIGLVLSLILFVIALVFNIRGNNTLSVMLYSLLCLGLVGWLIVPIFTQIFFLVVARKAMSEERLKDRVSADKYRTQSHNIEREANARISSIEQEIKSATVKQQGAERALQLLREKQLKKT